MKISAVDLFCGAGGLSYGLEQAGISVVSGIDNNPDCKYPYEQNIDATYVQSKVEPLSSDPERIARMFPWDADLKVLGACAPCQPYSTMGHVKDKSHADHDKWGLLRDVIQIIDYVEPDVVVTENVLQIQDDSVYDDFIAYLDDNDYYLNSEENRNVYCPEHGIPQNRKRWVVMASKRGEISLPEPLYTEESSYPTVRESIGHLPAIQAGEVHPVNKLHRSQNLSELNMERIQNIEPGDDWGVWEDSGLEHLLAECHKKASGSSYTAPYSRLEPDKIAPTITTQFYNYGSGRFGHYDTDQDRALSLLEGALLQTFPEDYDFYEDWDEVGVSNLGKLIGNAVPPRLGERIGEGIVQHVEGATLAKSIGVADD